MRMKSINPYTEEIMAEFDTLTWEETADKISKARETFNIWKNSDIKVRVRLLGNLAAVLRDNKKKYAELISREMGMIIRSSTASIEKCAWLCDYYSENAEKFLADEHIETQNEKSYISFELHLHDHQYQWKRLPGDGSGWKHRSLSSHYFHRPHKRNCY